MAWSRQALFPAKPRESHTHIDTNANFFKLTSTWKWEELSCMGFTPPGAFESTLLAIPHEQNLWTIAQEALWAGCVCRCLCSINVCAALVPMGSDCSSPGSPRQFQPHPSLGILPHLFSCLEGRWGLYARVLHSYWIFIFIFICIITITIITIIIYHHHHNFFFNFFFF